MKVLLKKDFDLLGAAGDIKEVKDGYARNYLIPHGIATAASPSNIKSFEEVKKQKRRKIEKETKDAKVIASRLESTPVTIQVKTAEEGKIYGSVTSQMILDILTEKGFTGIEKKRIIVPEHIKTLGEYTVDIKLYSNVVAKLKVIVDKEGTEEGSEEGADSEAQAEEEAKTD
jgi:large subunit ribosomal protein L9